MKQTQPTFAKLTVPSLPRIVERRRLFRRLDQARKRPLVWIAAPPGAGKTTLVASYLKARRLPVCWYRLDESDADPSSFFHFLSMGAQSLAPRFRRPLPVLTPEYALGLPTFARRFFRECCARLPRRCVLVLDNYHDVPAASGLHQLMAAAFEEVPEHVSVMVLSRHVPPAPLRTLEMRQVLTQVGPEHLELSKAEAKAIVHLHGQRGLGVAVGTLVDDVYRRMGGWAAGLLLTIEQMKRSASSLPSRSGHASEALFHYLAGEVMERLPPEVQQVLLRTSVLSDISVPMAERLTERSQAGEVLASLHAARYFTERREGAEPWYRYHPLFREFLLQRARQVWGPSDFRTLQRTAAQLLVAGGRSEDGVRLLQAAEDWEGLAPVILAQAQSLVAEGRIQTLESWIRSVPESVRRQIPWLNFWLATVKVTFSPDEAYGYFQQVFAQFRSQGDQVGVLLSWCGAIRAILIRWAGMSRLNEWLDLFPLIHPEGTPYPSVEVEAHVADCMAGAIMQGHPYRSDARAWLDKAVRLAEHLPPAMQTGSRYMLEVYYLWNGDFAAAEGGLAQYSRLAQTSHWNPMTTIFFHTLNATFAWFNCEFDLCRMHAGQARDLIKETGLHLLNGLVLSQGAIGEVLAGDLDAAEAILKEEDIVTHQIGGIHRAHYLHTLAWVKLLRGDMQAAWTHVEQSLKILAAEGSFMFGEGANGVVAAHVLRALGKPAEAAQWAEQTLQLADRMQSDLLRFGTRTIAAQLAFDRGDDAAGFDELAQAMGIGEARGLMQYPGMERDVTAQLCARALEAGIRRPFVRQMIRKLRLTAPLQAWASDVWPWPVKVTTLGRFGVQLHDRPLPQSRKASHRLLSLLQAIVAFGGREVPMARVTDALWPEAEGDAAYRALISALARLRKLLGDAQAILFHEGRLSLNTDLVWVDALAFETLAQEAERMTREDHAERSERLVAQALQLYRGSLLADEPEAPWAGPTREKCRARYQRLVEARVRLRTERAEWDQAVACAEQATHVEPLAEPLYRLLLTTLHRAGRTADLPVAYFRCHKALIESEGRPPSPETERLFKSLRSG